MRIVLLFFVVGSLWVAAATAAEENHRRVRKLTPDGPFEGPCQVTTGVQGKSRATERAPRTLADLRRISQANLGRTSALELSGLHPDRDWPLSLWVQRSQDAAKEKTWDAPIFLNGIAHLKPIEAKALAQFGGSRIFLPDLQTIDAVTADELARAKASLFLDGLKTLDVTTARTLARGRGRRLSLRGLTTLTPELAATLARYKFGLALDGVSMLDVATARELATWAGWGEQVLLSIGVRELDAGVARELAKCTGWGVALDRLPMLLPEAASALGALDNPYLSLGGLQSIPLETANVVSRWKRKFLTLEGVKQVSPEVRKLVERGCEAVSWRGLSGK